MLERCPKCGYSLRGLPDEYDCPECGRAYDRSAVLFRGSLFWHSLYFALAIVAFITIAPVLWEGPPGTLEIRTIVMMLGLLAWIIWRYRRRSTIVVSARELSILSRNGPEQVYSLRDVTHIAYNVIMSEIRVYGADGELLTMLDHYDTPPPERAKRLVAVVRQRIGGDAEPDASVPGHD